MMLYDAMMPMQKPGSAAQAASEHKKCIVPGPFWDSGETSAQPGSKFRSFGKPWLRKSTAKSLVLCRRLLILKAVAHQTCSSVVCLFFPYRIVDFMYCLSYQLYGALDWDAPEGLNMDDDSQEAAGRKP